MDTQYQCRPNESNSSRYILENTELDSITDKEVISLLIEYKTLLSKYDQLDAELSNYNKILFYQPDFAKENRFSQKANAIVSKMDKLDDQILDLETRPQLLEIVEKHRAEKTRQRAKEERDNRLHRFRTDPSFDPDKLTSTDIAWVAAQKDLDADTVKKILYLERQEMLQKVAPAPQSNTNRANRREHVETEKNERNTGKAWLIVLLIYAVLFIVPLIPNGGKTVYVTKTGECYHTSSCESLSHSKIKTTIEEAISKGFRRCNNCDPPVFRANDVAPVSLSAVSDILLIAVPVSIFTWCATVFIFPFFNIDREDFKFRWLYLLSVFILALHKFVI
ncbi:MAG: hypothetical protein IJB91_03805 [Oscillospiraceae bacterium]|nr:hypothetical protein [Oscillospiraceae bacterium]